MKKSTAIAIFGKTLSDLGNAIGLTKGRISQLPEDLDQPTTDRVVGAAVRMGRLDRLPPEYRPCQDETKEAA